MDKIMQTLKMIKTYTQKKSNALTAHAVAQYCVTKSKSHITITLLGTALKT